MRPARAATPVTWNAQDLALVFVWNLRGWAGSQMGGSHESRNGWVRRHSSALGDRLSLASQNRSLPRGQSVKGREERRKEEMSGTTKYYSYSVYSL